MNILYLHCHDAGRWLGPYDPAFPTPNLAALARRAAVFQKAFCVAPTCSPSRAALLTGQYPHQAGMIGLAHRGFALRHPERHLAAFLSKHGYDTALAGIQHEFAALPAGIYSERFQSDALDRQAKDEAAADWAAQWLRRRNHEQPFFLSCGFFYPHREFPEPDPALLQKELPVPAPLPDCAATRRDMAAYRTAAKMMDEGCGKVLDALFSSPRSEETLIFFTTDHGPAFPGMKCQLTDGGLGVALLLADPGNRCAGKNIRGMVSHLDIFPTICELAGLPAPGWLEGRSLVPLLSGAQDEIHEAIFGEVTYHAAYEPMRSVRTRRHKLIELFDQDTMPVACNMDDSPTKDAWMKTEAFLRPRDSLQLFDLIADPREQRNLAHDPAHRSILADLRGLLDDWMKDTRDPLLSGPVPQPPGSRVNRRESLRPSDSLYVTS